jgi:hypothetical protein
MPGQKSIYETFLVLPRPLTHRPLLPEKMAVASCAGVGRPGVVEAVALDLEGSAGAGQLVPHLLEKSAKRGLLDRDQPAAQLVPGVMVAAETEVNNYFLPVIV